MGKTLGDRLRALRKGAGQRQQDVAAAVGRSREHISNIERGRDDPGRRLLMALARHFNEPLERLMVDDGIALSGQPIAMTEAEILLLQAYRKLPPEDAAAILRLLLSRVRDTSN